MLSRGRWIAAWGASPQPADVQSADAAGFTRRTIRNVVFASAGGTFVRVRLTNAFGARRLVIGRAAVGAAVSGARIARPATVPLTFSGQPTVVIPPGADVLSDPARLPVRPLAPLAVSVFVPGPTGPPTLHAQARQITYIASGDHALDPGSGAFRSQARSWFFVDGVDVLSAAPGAGVVVALGDSITDGVGSPLDANARWPNDLARRLHARGGRSLSVVDEGIGGNRVLHSARCCGVDALVRFRRDVVDQLGAKTIILLEGINDIGMSQSRNPLSAPHTPVSAAQIIIGYEALIRRAHAAGLRIIGGTLTPFLGARYWTPAGEAKREAVNRWIRTSGAFDGVIDFARAVADPSNPIRLDPAYDSGDHLHPNWRGYRAMAYAVPLALLP